LQFAEGGGPTPHLEVGLRQLEMRFRETRIELDGSPVINQRIRILTLIKTLVTLCQEFLGIAVATGREK